MTAIMRKKTTKNSNSTIAQNPQDSVLVKPHPVRLSVYEAVRLCARPSMGTRPSNNVITKRGEDREDDGDGHHEEEDHQELELHDRELQRVPLDERRQEPAKGFALE